MQGKSVAFMKRFDDLLVPIREDQKNEASFRAWIVQASAAMSDVFPAKHPARVAWDAIEGMIDRPYHPGIAKSKLLGVFNGAAELIRQGYVETLADVIRADTLGELLDQADELVNKGHLIAAAAVAGGALESHLKHLCDRHNIHTSGHGSIAIYDQAVAQQRKAGNEVYSSNDSKSVLAWGGIRNDADHTPMKFAESKDRVAMMIQGIREFLTRVP